MKRVLLFALSLFSCFSPAFALTDICDISVGPDAKAAAFALGEQVSVSMGYVTDEPGGIRIFARPFTNGSLTPGYGASGSPVYTGSGTANGTFTINSGAAVVDEIRIEVYNADQSQLLRRMWIPVNFRFGSVGVNNLKFSDNPELSSMLLGEDYFCSFHYNVNYPGGVRIFVRPFTNGNITPGYSASGSGIYTGNGTNGGGSFRINTGKNVHVDAVRIKIVSADQTVDIDEFFIPVNVYYSTVKITDIAPQSGNFPFNNEDRIVSFQYSTTESGGVRIFPRPWTNGALTPNYGASGSGLYTGSGSGNGTFTITSGNQRVDHIRFNVTNADQSETLLQIWSPVEYCFGNMLIENVQLCPASPARLEHDNRVNINYGIYNDEGQPVRIFVRPFTQGSPTPAYAASPSPAYAVGSGLADDYFTITSGGVVVDQLRFQITTDDQSTVLAEYFIPVQYTFGNPTVSVNDALNILESTSLYPNPAGDVAFLSVSLQKEALARAYVTDLSGRCVLELGQRKLSALTPEQFQIPTSSLHPGLYIVVLEGEQFRQSSKLVVE
ncbi:MAG TPA: T9SS type A sorting domain-containing protein [Saprospiraceae bacterium]|nr:T9SS type A sorting domain-containing protein [Saprospiraceae bacterium]